MNELVFRGGTILTIDPSHRVVAGDVACLGGAIVQVGGDYTPRTRDYTVVDCTGCIVMPGLVQAHVHTCQTLARGRADDMELLDWLRTVVWPYEAALDEPAITASAELACAELLLGGTTAILDMGTVHHTDAVFAAAERSGIRATIGKAMMDAPDPQIPAGLRESTRASLEESARLIERWHGAAAGRLRYAYAPRFVPSCTDELLREVGVEARARGVRIHTHASENLGEIALVRQRFGKDNIVVLDELGLLGDHTCIAHCIHVSAEERRLLAARGAHVCHCPSSNLKLASGICQVPELIAAGISVALGADGAPSNNNLDGFGELRLAALLHKPRTGPRTLPAPEVVRMATLGGAAALGLADQIGSLELGKRGDVIAIDITALHTIPTSNPWSAIVYAARSCDVRHVAVDGAIVVRDGALHTLEVPRVRDRARTAAARLFR
ncbi:MAG TPA: 5'-deoxyadenosine deaminase [Kofleriaceae bacterium]|jgi:cytosine/adenosine deaminase-related metal-dependent hydrolase|nr:5'-deoxyadenosine deaminase [Kofleriaceae bacterium]